MWIADYFAEKNDINSDLQLQIFSKQTCRFAANSKFPHRGVKVTWFCLTNRIALNRIP